MIIIGILEYTNGSSFKAVAFISSLGLWVAADEVVSGYNLRSVSTLWRIRLEQAALV